MKRLWALAACVGLAIAQGCAPTLPQAYLRAHAEGDRAFSAGRFREAAQMYRQAAVAADRIKDRDEMLFLEASSYQRARDYAAASQKFRSLEELNPAGARAARSNFELAEIEISQGSEQRGYEMLEQTLRRYPDSGLARRALIRYVEWLDRNDDFASGLAWLRQNVEWLRKKGPGEAAVYLIADHMEKMGDMSGARDMFLTCAKDYPYPVGGLFDDSLYRASLLDERLGSPQLAIDHLRQLLRSRESSTLNGSYERPRYSQAQLRIARLLRDAIHDHAGARREFRKLFSDFTTSILRDDALWEEGLLAAQDGDAPGACDAMTLLVRKLPDSRYAACAHQICPTALASSKSGKCRGYIDKELTAATKPRSITTKP